MDGTKKGRIHKDLGICLTRKNRPTQGTKKAAKQEVKNPGGKNIKEQKKPVEMLISTVD